MALPNTKKNATRVTIKHNEEKWSKPLMDAGWTVIPSIILEKQATLNLDPIDLNIIMHLAKHWWYKNNEPFPSKGTIAKCMGIDPSTVRRHIADLEADGLITRIKRFDTSGSGRQETNRYKLDGLIKSVTPFAKEVIEARKNQINEARVRRNRNKPSSGLTVVKGGRE